MQTNSTKYKSLKPIYTTAATYLQQCTLITDSTYTAAIFPHHVLSKDLWFHSIGKRTLTGTSTTWLSSPFTAPARHNRKIGICPAQRSYAHWVFGSSAGIQHSHSCYLLGTLHNFLFSTSSTFGMKSNLLWPLSCSAVGGAPLYRPIWISGILPFLTSFGVLTITPAQAATLNISNYQRQTLLLRRLGKKESSSWQNAQSLLLLSHSPGSWVGWYLTPGTWQPSSFRLPAIVQRCFRCCGLVLTHSLQACQH